MFGGKIIVFGGDFKQVLTVVPHATKAETMNASLVMSYLWPKMEKLRLTRNMRAQLDTTFSDFLLRVGDGDENSTNEDMINTPNHMLVQYKHGDDPEKCMINTIFPSLREHASSSKYEVILVGLNLALALNATKVEGRSDSQIVVGQIQREYEVRNECMARYLALVDAQMKKVEGWLI